MVTMMGNDDNGGNGSGGSGGDDCNSSSDGTVRIPVNYSSYKQSSSSISGNSISALE